MCEVAVEIAVRDRLNDQYALNIAVAFYVDEPSLPVSADSYNPNTHITI